MNERINELIKQSYVTVRSQNDRDVTYFSQEKFAELIVQECAKECDNYAATVLRFSQFGANAAKDCANIIREKFGVEE